MPNYVQLGKDKFRADTNVSVYLFKGRLVAKIVYLLCLNSSACFI